MKSADLPIIARIGAGVDLGTNVADPLKGLAEGGAKAVGKAVVKGAVDAAAHGAGDAAAHSAGKAEISSAVHGADSVHGADFAHGAVAPNLPPFTGKTDGVLRTSNGDLKLQSGREGPAKNVPPKTKGFDGYTRTHVEGHAAAYMNKNSIKEATVYINNPTICGSCTKLLPRMLDTGTKLHVVTPDGAVHTFVGGPK